MLAIEGTTTKQERARVRPKGFKRTGGALALTAALFVVGCGDEARSGSATNSNEASAGLSVDNNVKPGAKVLLEDSRIKEVQQFGARTFSDYEAVSGVGPTLPKGEEVTVDCLATGPVEAAPSAKGKWYHIIAPAKYAGYFAAANTFENGDTSIPLEQQPAVDPNVPDCP